MSRRNFFRTGDTSCSFPRAIRNFAVSTWPISMARPSHGVCWPDADAAAVYAASGHLLFPRQGALLAQRFDVDRLTLSGEPWQVTESVGVDQTQGATRLSVSDTGSLVYRGTDVEARQRRLVWHDRSGKELQRLDDRDPVNANHMALSPDGRRLAVSRDSIWMFDTARGLLTRFTIPAGQHSALVPGWRSPRLSIHARRGSQPLPTGAGRKRGRTPAGNTGRQGRQRLVTGRTPVALSRRRSSNGFRSVGASLRTRRCRRWLRGEPRR